MSQPPDGSWNVWLAKDIRALLDEEIRKTGRSEQDVVADCVHRFTEEISAHEVSIAQTDKLMVKFRPEDPEEEEEWDEQTELRSQFTNAAIWYALKHKRVM